MSNVYTGLRLGTDPPNPETLVETSLNKSMKPEAFRVSNEVPNAIGFTWL